MSNVLNDEKKKQVIALGQLGWTLRDIEKKTGIRRETASRYLRAVGIEIRRAGNWGHVAKPAIEASPDSEPITTGKPAIAEEETSPDSPSVNPTQKQPTRSPQASACEPYRDFITESLGKGRNAKAIWQDLVDYHGFQAAYQSVKRFVRQHEAGPAPEARVIIHTAPGEEAQVDYGDGPMVRHPETGKYRRTRLFVMTLGYSRKSVRFLVFQSSSQIWAELHEKAFRRLGGATKVAVIDNLKEGVLKPEIYDPQLNPLYRDVLQHYGVVALPCRVNDPDRKGKVERGVGHAKNTPLKGLRFESLAAAQTYLDRWETNWADTRIHGTTKRQVAVMFAEEQPALQPLPLEPFRYYRYGERTVHPDGCVEVDLQYFSAPPRWLGRLVQVQWDQQQVRILDPKTGLLLREHRREPKRHHIHPEDEPPRTPLSTLNLLSKARQAGEHIGALCRSLHQQKGQVAVRQMQGLLSFTKKYGVAALDDACGMALESGNLDYHFVRKYLERRAPFPALLRKVDPLIRELTHYRDLIAARSEPTPGEPSE